MTPAKPDHKPGQKLGNVAFINDERVSPQRLPLLQRCINEIRTFANVQTFKGDISEIELLKALKEKNYQLIIAPWYRYLSWNKIEAHLGTTRNSGPTFAGYATDQILPYELGDVGDHSRLIFLDFYYMNHTEVRLLVRNLLQEKTRSGVRPFLDKGNPVYFENWNGLHSSGFNPDAILKLPEIAASISTMVWNERANAMRIALLALWSLVYDHGTGKTNFAKGNGSASVKAHFQVGVHPARIYFRLLFTLPNTSPKNALEQFWPNPATPEAPAQLLLRYADFVRLHPISKSQEFELTVGFFSSDRQREACGSMRTLWIDPIAPNLITEPVFDTKESTEPLLKAMPSSAPAAAQTAATPGSTTAPIEKESANETAKDRYILEMKNKLIALNKVIADKDETIRTLRAGGVGTVVRLAPPDTDSLFEAFEDRFLAELHEIEELEFRIEDMQDSKASPQEIDILQRKLKKLSTEEQAWVRRMIKALEEYKGSRKKAA